MDLPDLLSFVRVAVAVVGGRALVLGIVVAMVAVGVGVGHVGNAGDAIVVVEEAGVGCC